jgi:hypothetical protein
VTNPTVLDPKEWRINATHEYQSRRSGLIFHQIDAELYDRMVVVSASRNIFHQERQVKNLKLSKRVWEITEPGEVVDTPTAIKKLKFSENKPDPVQKGAETSEVKQLTAEEVAAKKEKKAAKAAKAAKRLARKAKAEKCSEVEAVKAKAEKSSEMDVD